MSGSKVPSSHRLDSHEQHAKGSGLPWNGSGPMHDYSEAFVMILKRPINLPIFDPRFSQSDDLRKGSRDTCY